MYEADGQLILSPGDLNHFIECPYLTRVDLRTARGEVSLEPARDDTSDLLARKGDEHELAYLEQLRAEGKSIVEIPELEAGEARDPAVLGERAAATEQAMRGGADVVYQGTFFSDGWRGHADFLEKVERPSEFGIWSYEVVDTKLAHRTKPYFLLQICAYTDELARIQGVMPERMHVVLGTHTRESFRCDEFIHYFRRLRAQFVGSLSGGLADAEPYPIEYCDLCRWSDHCIERWEREDHLSQVAKIRRQQTVRLHDVGIDTATELGQADDSKRPGRIQEHTFNGLRQQARLQTEQCTDGDLRYELLEPEDERGFQLLPPPDEGDIFFDMEGDPFFENGLEYLFGLVLLDDGEAEFKPFWGRTREEERQAFERFVDFVTERRQAHPGLHVYHYAHYEPTTLKRLMGFHATREDEIDDLLRNGVFVDLYRVVDQSMRISQPSYSIKQVEPFYMGPREAEVKQGGDSILMFEEWLESGDDELLEKIERYNEEDCRSTHLLREWLLERRDEAAAQYSAAIPWREPPEPYEPDREVSEEVELLKEALLEGIDREPDADRAAEEQSRWLAAQLIDYHRREAKPAWWSYFAHLDMSDEELLDGGDGLAGLVPDGKTERLPPPSRSTRYRFTFPTQDHHIGPGAAINPRTEKSVKVEAVEDVSGTLSLTRGNTLEGEPLPTALIPQGPYNTPEQQAALRRFGQAVIDDGVGSESGSYRAAKALLAGEVPRTSAVDPGAELQANGFDLDRAARLVEGLDSSHLFIQGPPGSGKTYNGGQLIARLLQQGARVGVTSNSHKAIHQLLHQVEAAAEELNFRFHGLQKQGSGPDTKFATTLDEAMVTPTDSNGSCEDREVKLVAGTAWLFCREGMDSSLDYLFVDEAGQVSLADAIALATSARNVVLLGDPLQLAQVSQAVHPPGAGASVLEHLLGNEGTIPRDHGLFIDQTRRMHPDVCEFISDAIYEGRLSSIEDCGRQDLRAEGGLTGTGIRWLPVEHEANQRRSPEEAQVVAEAVNALHGAAYVRADGTTASLEYEDIMVVAPYNSQVRCLREALPDAIPVGTVDKFQGQEAAVVFFSMATSTGEDVPRNMEFLFSRNRLNVAISRARCLAVVVCNPALTYTHCRTAGQMQLVNVLCRLVEMTESRMSA